MNRILAELNTKPWLIQGDYFKAILNVVNKEDILNNLDSKFISDKLAFKKQALEKQAGTPKTNTYNASQRGSVGILNITGPIVRYGGMMELSGYTSLEKLSKEFTKLEEDKSIKTIILNIDSPGGQAASIAEFSEHINKSKKQVISYVDDMCASAAYWIASASSKIVAGSTSMVGSIGVVFSISDNTKARKAKGIEDIEIVSSVSPKKRPDLSTDEGKAQIQSWADKLGFKFVSAVAKYRGKDFDTVLEKFGKGDMLIASEAKEAGMIDELGDFESLIQAYQTKNIHFKQGESHMNENEFKEQEPKLYESIFGAGVAQGKALELKRIEAIEDVIPQNVAQSIELNTELKALKFDGKSDAKTIKAFLFDAQEKQKASLKIKKQEEANELNASIKELSTFETKEVKKDTAKSAIDKINIKRSKA